MRVMTGTAAVILITSCFGFAGLSACGSDDTKPSTPVEGLFVNKCAQPRTGTDPVTSVAYPDTQGTLDDEKFFLQAWTDDLYLWYSEVPDANPSSYPTALAYFNVLKTPKTTASGKPKDQFHFTYATADWEALSGSGVEAGYGVEWDVVAPRPPREIIAVYTQPNSAATGAGVARGMKVLAVDGEDAVSGSDVDTLNGGLFPAGANESHTFLVQDLGANATRTLTMMSGSVTRTPVQDVIAIDTPTGKVGYMHFTDFIATAEFEVATAVSQLQTAGITDLVLDIRYNGGGYLDIASEVGFMIAGPNRSAGKTFEKTLFNDKHPTVDPVTGDAIAPTLFDAKTLGFSATAGQALPHLDLPRVYILTGSGTCSASEAVMNALAGIDVEVIQIGTTTCGKPYGFYPQDNCGTTYFAIQFQGVNDKGFGDYADGFSPGAAASGATLRGCQVADDFTHLLGDPAEARLSAALAFRATGTCPAATGLIARKVGGDAAATTDGQLHRNPFRENRIMRR